MEADESHNSGGGGGAHDPGGHAPRDSRGGKPSPEAGGGDRGGHEHGGWKDTPNAELLVALSRWVWRRGTSGGNAAFFFMRYVAASAFGCWGLLP